MVLRCWRDLVSNFRKVVQIFYRKDLEMFSLSTVLVVIFVVAVIVAAITAYLLKITAWRR